MGNCCVKIDYANIHMFECSGINFYIGSLFLEFFDRSRNIFIA